MGISNAVFEYVTNLQYKVKSLTSRVQSFESGERYEYMRKDLDRRLAEKDRQIKKLKLEIANAHAETVTVRQNFMQANEDLHAEHAKEIGKKDKTIKALEERALKAERLVDELRDEIKALKKEHYAVQVELLDERDKRQKLIAQINHNHENSSIPSSQIPNHKKITNNREKTGKSPGAQHGHEGHGRKAQIPSETIQLKTPEEYVNNPDYEPTGRLVKRQRVGLRVVPYTVEYVAVEYRNKETGKLVYAEFPEGWENDINYDGSVKAFALILNNYCNVSIDKTREFISEITGGALEISKGMINGLGKEFSKKTKDEQTEAFLALAAASVLHVDFTTAKVNGKNVNVAICATPLLAAYFAREHKGHDGIKGTPAEVNPNTLVHDHDKTFYNYGRLHQECLIHILRYLLDSIQNEKNLTWSTKMRELIQEMVHYHNSLAPEDDLDPDKVKEFELRFVAILDIADREYEYEPPSKYYRNGYNLKERLREFQDAHLLFLHDKNVPTNNNLAERLLRIFKRKMRQVMTYRSFESLEHQCATMTILSNLRNNKTNLYERVSLIFS